jgi:hypothetical protein
MLNPFWDGSQWCNIRKLKEEKSLPLGHERYPPLQFIGKSICMHSGVTNALGTCITCILNPRKRLWICKWIKKVMQMQASPWLLRSGCGAWLALRLVFPHVFFQFNLFIMDKVRTLERLPILFGFPKNWLWTEILNIFAVYTNKHSCIKSCRLDCLSWWELFLQSRGVSAHKQTLLLWPMFTCFIRSEVGLVWLVLGIQWKIMRCCMILLLLARAKWAVHFQQVLHYMAILFALGTVFGRLEPEP